MPGLTAVVAGPMPDTALALIAIAAYLAAALLLWRGLRRDGGWLPAVLAGLLGALGHAALLGGQAFQPAGLLLGVGEVASLTGWLIGLTVLSSLHRRDMYSVGVLVLPLVAASLTLPWLFGTGNLIRHAGWPLAVHILSSLLAYSLLATAAVFALLLAVQDHLLRRHRAGELLGLLPPLALLEDLLFRFIGTGFVLLSLALFSGLLFVEDVFAQHLAHKTGLSISAWLIFGTLLVGRWRGGWRGRRAIRWTLAGFILLALAYFGSKLVLEVILGRHWFV